METFYTILLKKVRKSQKREKITICFCKGIPYVTGISYLGVLLYLAVTKDPRLLAAIGKPLGVFIVVTVIRKIINRPRPYDTLYIDPLFMHKHGESFPSRHTASAFIIALTCFSIIEPLGIVLLVVASLVAVTRIVAGVHYISDVLVAILIAYVGWWI